MDELEQQAALYCREHHLLEKNSTVLIGLSGGADSVCLAGILCALRREWQLSLFALHVHHGLREGADKDASFVRDFCREKDIPCTVVYADVAGEAKEKRLSVEEAGRMARRNAFEAACRSRSIESIALAHHKDDQAETILWNLFRGSGMRGLAGMAPRNGRFIRPLLFASRKDIEAYLERAHQPYCTDETNLTNLYTRNKIRHDLIPFIQKECNAQAVDHIVRMGQLAGQQQAYVEKQAEKAKAQCVTKEADGSVCLCRKAFLPLEAAVQGELLRNLLEETAGRQRDIGHVHIEVLRRLLEMPVGRRLSLPYAIQAESTYAGIRLRKQAEKETVPLSPGFSPEASDENRGAIRIYPTEACIRNELPRLKSPQGAAAPSNRHSLALTGVFTAAVKTLAQKNEWAAYTRENTYTKCFDYDIIKGGLRLRTRQAQDRLAIAKNGGSQKLKDYFINEKVPRDERDFIPLLAEGSEILWVVGHRMSEKYKVTEKTKRVLMVSCDIYSKDVEK